MLTKLFCRAPRNRSLLHKPYDEASEELKTKVLQNNDQQTDTSSLHQFLGLFNFWKCKAFMLSLKRCRRRSVISESVTKKLIAHPSKWVGQMVNGGSIRYLTDESLSNSSHMLCVLVENALIILKRQEFGKRVSSSRTFSFLSSLPPSSYTHRPTHPHRRPVLLTPTPRAHTHIRGHVGSRFCRWSGCPSVRWNLRRHVDGEGAAPTFDGVAASSESRLRR